MGLGNYIPDSPKMAEPPAFWLQRLYDFDNQLVVMPSRQRPYAYVLARRARRSAATLGDMVGVLEGDTAMCVSYGCVPVSLILRTGEGWEIDGILADLKSRDIWEHGGGDKAADLMDQADAKARARIKADIRDDMWMRSGDAWRSYQARTGQRTKLNRPTAKKAAGQQPSPPSRSTAGLGQITLTDAV